MFSIACTVTKKSVLASPPPSPTGPKAATTTVVTSSVQTTVTRIHTPESNFPQRRRSTFRRMLMTLTIIALASFLSAFLVAPATGMITPYAPSFSRTRSQPFRYDSIEISRFRPCDDEVSSRIRHAAWLDHEYGQSPAHRAHHLPQCLPNGRYNATQCRTELDLCWCVGERTGHVLSHVFHPGHSGEVRCSDEVEEDEEDNNNVPSNNNSNSTMGNGTISNNNQTTNATNQVPQPPPRRRRQGPCVWAKRQISARRGSGREPLLGSFEPECTDEGLFERTQCHASSGFCWCVDEYTGERVSPAFRQWANGIDCEGEEFLVNASFRP